MENGIVRQGATEAKPGKINNEELVINWADESHIPSIHKYYNSANHVFFPEVEQMANLDYVV